MGLFGDKQLINIGYKFVNEGIPVFNILTMKDQPEHILPFCGISLIINQLSIMSPRGRRLLINKMLDFICEPNSSVNIKKENLISGFSVELFQKNTNYLYNQFSPYLKNSNNAFNPQIEPDITECLTGFVNWIYGNLNVSNKDLFITNLVLAMCFHVKQIEPDLLKNFFLIAKGNIEIRKIIAKLQISMCSIIYNQWNNPPFIINSTVYSLRIEDIKFFLNPPNS